MEILPALVADDVVASPGEVGVELSSPGRQVWVAVRCSAPGDTLVGVTGSAGVPASCVPGRSALIEMVRVEQARERLASRQKRQAARVILVMAYSSNAGSLFDWEYGMRSCWIRVSGAKTRQHRIPLH